MLMGWTGGKGGHFKTFSANNFYYDVKIDHVEVT